MRYFALVTLLLLVNCAPPGPGGKIGITVQPAVYVPKTAEELFLTKPDFVGIVRISEVPSENVDTLRANSPPTVLVTPISVLTGNPKAQTMRVVWQTHVRGDSVQDPKTVSIKLPAVNEQYIVFLVRKGDKYERLDNECSFHKLPVAPNVSIDFTPSWRAVEEVSPFLTQPGEPVQYRFSRTRIDAEPWTGSNENFSATELTVIDVTRKKILTPKNPEKRQKAFEDVRQGQAVVYRIELNKFFDIEKPGEYWLRCQNEAVLRFEVSDKVTIR